MTTRADSVTFPGRRGVESFDNGAAAPKPGYRDEHDPRREPPSAVRRNSCAPSHLRCSPGTTCRIRPRRRTGGTGVASITSNNAAVRGPPERPGKETGLRDYNKKARVASLIGRSTNDTGPDLTRKKAPPHKQATETPRLAGFFLRAARVPQGEGAGQDSLEMSDHAAAVPIHKLHHAGFLHR